jgi:hypothetical protein
VALNDRGDATFCFFVDGKNPRAAALYHFLEEKGELVAVVLPGDPAPCGRAFAGCGLHPALNNHGDLVFPARVTEGDLDPNVNPPGEDGEGSALFLYSRRNGEISKILCPGELAPDGVFDHFINPWINDRGDIAFGAHLQGEECIPVGGLVECGESIYLRRASGEVVSIAHQGAPAPGGGIFRLAFGPIVNNRGEVLFIGDLTQAPEFGEKLGVYLYTRGETVRIAGPGDEMPGGGRMTTTGFFVNCANLNHCGEVCFAASLETDEGPAQGLYLWSGGRTRLVARSGTELPGLGVVEALLPPVLIPHFPDEFPWPYVGAGINDRGQILTQATLKDGRNLLLLATPEVERSGCPAAAFVRGDADADGQVSLTDAVRVLTFLFTGGPAPECMDAADADDSGGESLSVTDAIRILGWLFTGGPAPPAPSPSRPSYLAADCGIDPTPTSLGCETPPATCR